MITIVISSYRYGHLASHCIESVLSQTKNPGRILFVDDGVGDCQHLPKIYPQLEYYFREYNLGIVENFDDMLRKVDSEYVMFLGADNWIRSDTVEVFQKVISEHNPDVITYDIMVTGELKNEISNAYPHQVTTRFGDIYWSRRNSHHGSMVYRTKLGQEIGYRKRDNQSKNSDEDWYLWEQMLNRGATVSYIPEALLYYRRHKENFNFIKNKITK